MRHAILICLVHGYHRPTGSCMILYQSILFGCWSIHDFAADEQDWCACSRGCIPSIAWIRGFCITWQWGHCLLWSDRISPHIVFAIITWYKWRAVYGEGNFHDPSNDFVAWPWKTNPIQSSLHCLNLGLLLFMAALRMAHRSWSLIIHGSFYTGVAFDSIDRLIIKCSSEVSTRDRLTQIRCDLVDRLQGADPMWPRSC